MIRTTLAAALAAVLGLAGPPAAAQEGGGRLALGGDAYAGGSRIAQTEAVPGDLFLVGESVAAAAPVAGAAHLAGRRVEVTAEVSGNLYAAGMDVGLAAPVGGSASLAGYDVAVQGPVGRNLRAAGQRVTLAAPVAGAALIAAEEARIDAAIGGDLRLIASRVAFGPGARVDGTLTLVSETPEAIEVPAAVAPPGRILRERAARAPGVAVPLPGPTWPQVALGLLAVVAGLTVLTGLLALIAPRGMADLRRRIVEAPFRAAGLGFLALSALTGAVLVVALTLVGLLLSPAAALLALAAGFAGYLVGLYALGAGMLVALGRGEPELPGERLMAALLGAVLASLIALVPFAGWLFVLALVLAGTGALTARWLRPAFFAA